MKRIQITYTIIDAIKVPDNWTEEEIDEAVSNNTYDLGIWGKVDDAEWEVVE